MKKLLFIISLIVFQVNIYSQNKPSYPESKIGFKRVDLILPKLDNEKNYKVEVSFGLEANVYECSVSSFSFNIKNLKKEYGIQPYRFPFYLIENNLVEITESKNSNCVSEKKIIKKIISEQNISIEYQSYYPVPFFIPENWTLEYRIWQTSEKFTTVK